MRLFALSNEEKEFISSLNATKKLLDIPSSLRDSRDVALAAVKVHGIYFKHIAVKFRAEKEMLLIALKSDMAGMYLQYASIELQADREIVLAAVTNDGHALQWASKELQADREIVLTAVSNHGLALQCASKKLQADREIVAIAVNNYGKALKYANSIYQNNKEIVLVALYNYPKGYRYCTNKLQNDIDVILASVLGWHGWLEFSDEYRNDRQVLSSFIYSWRKKNNKHTFNSFIDWFYEEANRYISISKDELFKIWEQTLIKKPSLLKSLKQEDNIDLSLKVTNTGVITLESNGKSRLIIQTQTITREIVKSTFGNHNEIYNKQFDIMKDNSGDWFVKGYDVPRTAKDEKGNTYNFHKTLYNGNNVTNKFTKIEDGGVIKIGNEEFIVRKNNEKNS